MKYLSSIIQSASVSIVFATFALSAQGQTIPSVAPEIVSAWKANVGTIVIVFRHDGVFNLIDGEANSIGMERGRFVWNKQTSAFTANVIVDTNGESGLSHPLGAASISITGNNLTYTVVGEGSFSLSRVINTSSAIVGSWHIPGDPTTVTFLADGTYYATEEENDAPFEYDGMERGTYTWNSASGVLTAVPIIDTNGNTGLSNLPAGFTGIVSGNTLTVPDDGETTIYRRIFPNATPLNEASDFEVDKFSNFQQSGDANPVQLAGLDAFWGEAYIEPTVSGTGGTLIITGQPARNFVDVGGNEWEIFTSYNTLTQLNAASAFPNNANYIFARAGGSSTLSYPASGSFPPAPKIQPIDDDDGTWSAGKYKLGGKQTLTWGAHINYDSTKLVTVLSVEDLTASTEIMNEQVIQGDITSYDLSGKLTLGHEYSVTLEHVKIASSTTSGTGPFSGKLGYALYNSNTRFTMIAPDAPSTEPMISLQPQSRGVALNSTVSFQVATVDESPNQTYQWFFETEPIVGQTANSLRLFNISADDYGNYQVRVTNAEGNTDSQIATLGPPDPFDTYIAGYGLDPATTGAPDADFDKDGIANLLEFLLGGNPTLPNANLLPNMTTTPIAGGRNMVFTYKRKLAATGVTQVIEHSTNLSPPWNPAVHGADGVTITTSQADGSTEQVTVTIPSTSGKFFVRLKASR